jgi:amino acid adenylation domain-containing protein
MGDSAITGFRLSAQQERTFAQTAGEKSPYRSYCVTALDGPLETARLESALRKAVARHEILRTVFLRQAGVKLPFQVIREDIEPSCTFSECGSEADSECIARLLKEFNSREFDLEHGPLLRAVIAKVSDKRHVLLLGLPSVCADMQSLQNLINEIGKYCAEESSSDDAMQYADFVEWQHELQAGEDTKAGSDFWRDYCRNIDLQAAANLRLPAEQNPAVAFSDDKIAVGVKASLFEAMEELVKRLQVSSSTLVLASWQALLWRLTGASEFPVSFESDGRKYEELACAVGLFSQPLPLRARVDGDISFEVFAQQCHKAVNEIRSWEESFSWSALDSTSRTSLPFSYAYHNIASAQQYGELRIGWLEQSGCSEPFKLKLVALHGERDLKLEFHYDAGRFEPSAVERIAGYFLTLLQAAVAAPDTPVSRLPLLGSKERDQILVRWNQTAAEYPRTQCLQQLFEAQADRTPERAAVRCADQQLSYRQLNQRSNQLAHYLRSNGVAPDSLVGLCLDRSVDVMVAVLGILKAGGAYVPLNPDNPKPRLAQQLAGAVAILTEQKLLTQMPQFSGKTLCLDRDQPLWANQPSTNPQTNTTPENLVYVIYTSGSTGVPKGVAVRHRNLVNYTHFISQRLELERHPEGLQFATVSTIGADLGNTCIYPALVSGGCLHVIPYEVSTDAQRLADYARANALDVLKIVPSHLAALLQSAEAAQVLPREYLITGGETLTPALVEKVQSLGTKCRMLNHYGPTETTVGSLTLWLRGSETQQAASLQDGWDWKNSPVSSIPIGRPIANTQVYILDSHLQPVPVGVIGELYIAGDGVTAGYLNQPELTAERFLQNPFSNHPQARMYRTGDLARYLPGGEVEFLGRGDDQVKIRGFRIELGEIEAVLAKQAGIKQAFVIAKEDAHGDKRLLAYVVGQRESSRSPDDLKAALRQQLPDYMIPAAIVPLPKLPLNANGKIDRQALPEPEQVQAKAYVGPRNAVEETVAGIWAEVLHRDRVSIDDNFFDLGGHSLMATQVISRIRRALKIELPLRALFEAPTVASIAERIGTAGAKTVTPPPITRVSREQDLPLSFAQQRLWVLDQMEPANPLYNIPRGLRMRGSLNVGALERALNEIVRRHESQRTTFAVKNGNPLQVIAPDLRLVGVPQRDLTSMADTEREKEALRMAREEAQQPFDLAKGPLVRAQLLKLAPDDHILLLTMHHIVSDAWSAGIFLTELSELYAAFLQNQPSPLPELAIQYADYAAWQRGWLQGEVLEEQLKYWRKQLHGAPLVLELPTDRPRPRVRSFQGAYDSIPMSAEIAALAKEFSQREGVTLFMTLLAGFQALLSRYSGQEQIVIGTDLANRTTTETERLIGFFINLLAMRTDLSGNPTFRNVVERVREVALGAYAHQDMPFDKLVEELQPERSLSHNPLVQVLFVMQNIPRPRRDLPGLQLMPFEVPITRSKFDLAVFMVESSHGLASNWLYSTDLFDASSIRRMAAHFETLLRHAISAPDTRLGALEFMTREEQQQRGAQKQQRKQSQLKKLMSLEPKAVSLSQDRSEE